MPYDVTPASRFEKALAGTLADPSNRTEKALTGQGLSTNATALYSDSGDDLTVSVDGGSRYFLGTYKAALIL